MQTPIVGLSRKNGEGVVMRSIFSFVTATEALVLVGTAADFSREEEGLVSLFCENWEKKDIVQKRRVYEVKYFE